MGELADMIMQGVICERCGEMVGEAVGHPRSCLGCEQEALWEEDDEAG